VLEFFYLLAALQVLAGIYLTVEGLRWNSYVRRQMLSHAGFYSPRAAVLCPCKGAEPGLEQNLQALCGFDYANYEVFFIVASEGDAAHGILQRVAAAAKPKVHIVVAGMPQGCGEKVNNLRAAIEQLPPDMDVLVFADSDGRPGRRWLKQLVAPLNDAGIGAATTMRWYMPERRNFSSALLAAWNAPVVTLLGDHERNFCWGGGTAIRRSVFEQAGVLAEWQGSVSDDYSMTRALRRSGRRIQFVPQCLTPTPAAADFAGLMEFTNRQILITRVYAPGTWWPAAVMHLLFCVTILSGGLLFLVNLVPGRPAFHLALLTILPVVLAAVRGAFRIAGVSEALPQLRAQIMDRAWIWTVLGAFTSFLYAYNFLHSLTTRTIAWRGMQYELISPTQTRVVSR
jgi:cellulose synthase/poly-beta-1,6-N-acetylglucosamine synthase-like glycosyltransferase